MQVFEPFGLEQKGISFLKVDLNVVWERELGSRGQRRESSHLLHYSIYGVSSLSVSLHQMDLGRVELEAGK
jgi:hypothetical protein